MTLKYFLSPEYVGQYQEKCHLIFKKYSVFPHLSILFEFISIMQMFTKSIIDSIVKFSLCYQIMPYFRWITHFDKND